MYLIDLGVPKIVFLFFFLGGIWRGCLALTFICIQSVNFPCTHQLTRLFRSVTFPQRSDHETDRPSECLTVFLFLFLSSSRSPLDRPTDQPIGRLGGLASGSVYPTNWWWHHETFAPSVWWSQPLQDVRLSDCWNDHLKNHVKCGGINLEKLLEPIGNRWKHDWNIAPVIELRWT